METDKKKELLPRARLLYAEGLSTREVAAALDVSQSTVRRWARREEEAGRPWSREGSDPGATLLAGQQPLGETLRRKVQERLDQLMAMAEENLEDSKLEDRILKLCRVLDYLRKQQDDLGAQLRALRKFAEFCLRHLTEEEMTPVRKAVRLFVDHLREEYS